MLCIDYLFVGSVVLCIVSIQNYQNYETKGGAQMRKLRYPGRHCRQHEWDLVTTFAVCQIAFFTISLLINVINHGGVFTEILHRDTKDAGMDFFNSIIYTYSRRPYLDCNTLYPPLANLLFYLIFLSIPWKEQAIITKAMESGETLRCTENDLRLMQAPMVMFILFIMLSSFLLIAMVAFCVRGSMSQNFLLASGILLSIGVLYAFHRGNIIVLVTAAMLFFVQYRNSENPFLREMALIMLAVAAGLKLYPALLGILLLRDRKWLAAVRAVIYGLVAFILPFFFFNGTASMEVFFQMLFKFYEKGSSAILGGLGFKQIIHSFTAMMGLGEYGSILKYAQYFAFACGGISMFLIVFTKSHWKAVSLACVLTVVLPGTSGAYSLVCLIPGLICFLKEANPSKLFTKVFFVVFVLCFAVIPWPHVEYFTSISSTKFFFADFMRQVSTLLFCAILFVNMVVENVKLISKKLLVAHSS